MTDANRPSPRLPPILIDANGTAEVLDTTADFPLGVYPEPTRNVNTVDLPPGSTLLLYSDGLIERRDRHRNKVSTPSSTA